MPDFVINGKFATQQMTGVQRYASAIVAALDKMVAPDYMALAVPTDIDTTYLGLRNIATVEVGKHAGLVWEQIELPRYVRRAGATCVNLCNAAPIIEPGIVCVHDALVRAFPHSYELAFVLWYRVLLSRFSKRAQKIITVSNFSKSELEKYYPRMKGRITVIPNAWQHIDGIEPDYRVLASYSLSQYDGFFLSIASTAIHKNFDWVIRTARINPGELFVVAGGGIDGVLRKVNLDLPSNVLALGRVTDEELKALMTTCKAFLFPSLYEGFGLPPLEALACGAKTVVSDIPVFREVFGETAIRVDPSVPIDDLASLIHRAPANASETLEKYSWEASAKRLLSVMEA